jgi:glutathione S-transferase
MPDAVLISFPPSLDCELARFLLAHHAFAHVERPHALIFSSFASLWRGFTVRFPLLRVPGHRLCPVREVVDYLEPLAAPERRLLPETGARQAADADWGLFNGTLAFATATFGYHHLLRHRRIMIRPLSKGAPRFEVFAVRWFYPVFAGLLRLMLRLTDDRAAAALDTVRGVLDGVDARLADGRRYLAGDHFSLSDMAFAVALSPLVLPEPYGGALPSLGEMPAVMRHAIVEIRARPAGQHALRIYRDHRAGQVAGNGISAAGSPAAV